MPNTESRLLRVAAARADFLEGGRRGAAGMPEVLAASWERSQAAGVDVTSPHADFTDEIDTGSLLVRCARPVLERIGADTVDLPLVIALTDVKARVVQRIDSSASVGRLLDRVEFAPGFNYAESSMGTNGVGTVLEAGQAVSIVGPEHFSEHLQPFACTGAPVIDPVTGRVEGVLDISCLTPSWSPLMHTLVKSAAEDIGRNLLLDRSQSQQAIFDTYLQVVARAPRNAVFAFGESIFMANPQAQALFGAADQQIIRDHATFLMTRRSRASDTIMLADGRFVHVRGTRILAGSELAGMVVIADLVAAKHSGRPGDVTDQVLPQVAVATAQTSQIAGSLARPRDAISGGRTPAWMRACEELREALDSGTPTVVMGETGTGKFTLVAEIFQETHPSGRSISIDADQLTGEAERGNLTTLLDDADATTLLIVRNLDQAGTEAVEQLDALFAAAAVERPTWFVATLSDSSLDSDLPFHAVLKYFRVAITLPPLRLRTDDLPAITAALLRDIAPDRRVRLSPEAQRLVVRYTWPRNVAQLRDALVYALRRRPVGEIQGQDLPAYCLTSARHTLSPLECAERDAIVAALREHNGNKVVAATHLGMSRSSLYRKLGTYGINL